MTEPTIVDARGYSCPEPVLMSKRALLSAEEDRVEVLVDTETSVQNVTRAAKSVGWEVRVEETDGEYRLIIERERDREREREHDAEAAEAADG